MEFKHYLDEMSIAGFGDWQGTSSFASSISTLILNKNWEKIHTFNKLDLYKINTNSKKKMYILGNFKQGLDSSDANKTRFEINAQIEITPEIELEKEMNEEKYLFS